MEAVKKRNEARLNMIQNSSMENQTKYKHYKEIVNKTIRREKRLVKKRALEKLVEERNNPKKFFKHCKRLKQGFKQQTLFLKNDQNDLISEPGELVHCLGSTLIPY